ncbi:PLAT/LH2 domain-containing protein [Lentzea nigeriaca]|uniref:PLAT/LH2 domain-containing protein n=1 Tax=Lentzea nigeriaca TaxID=1128665 RepID=UPI001959F7AE|nr:PLAT/LH2 domain-containing protein [Lentzea nigeriaca]MBM7856935.1 phosphate-selective porin [Lentzea nigeriaca]
MRNSARAIVGISAAALATVMGMATAQAAPAQYNIEVRTCNVEDAGTDARVEVRLNGSSWINLDNPGDDRERGRTDTYNFTLSDLGPITSLAIAFDNKGDSSHWCLEEVVVRGPHGVTIHPLHNWLRRAYTKASPLTLPAA